MGFFFYMAPTAIREYAGFGMMLQDCGDKAECQSFKKNIHHELVVLWHTVMFSDIVAYGDSAVHIPFLQIDTLKQNKQKI